MSNAMEFLIEMSRMAFRDKQGVATEP